MKNTTSFNTERRQFITNIMPACALTYLSGESVFAMAKKALQQDGQQSKHLFDSELPLTMRQYYARSGRNDIVLFNIFAEAFGKKKVIALLKEHTYNRAKRNGERFRRRKGTNDFETFKTRFIGPGSYTERLIVAEIIENSKNVLELKATECVIAEAYLKENAGDYGYAYNCWGDHCWQDGYNKKIKLIRDKTLMQGHDCCNFKYVWEG